MILKANLKRLGLDRACTANALACSGSVFPGANPVSQGLYFLNYRNENNLTAWSGDFCVIMNRCLKLCKATQ